MSTIPVIKEGDIYDVTFTVTGPNSGAVDLTGATARLIVHRRGSASPRILPVTVTDAANGVVAHTLDGELPAGDYWVEIEVTKDGEIFTSPSAGVAQLRVETTLDPDD